jgi:hypothetical protein
MVSVFFGGCAARFAHDQLEWPIAMVSTQDTNQMIKPLTYRNSPGSPFLSKGARIDHYRPVIGALFACLLSAQLIGQQPPPPGPGPNGPHGFGSLEKRLEMFVDRVSEDLALDKNQRKEFKDIIQQAQTAAEPVQQELQNLHKSLKEAIKNGKSAAVLDKLQQEVGATHIKLAVLQSTAFANAFKLLKEDQKDQAGIIYDMLPLVMSPSGRGGAVLHNGPPGFNGPPRSGRDPVKLGKQPPPDGNQ